MARKTLTLDKIDNTRDSKTLNNFTGGLNVILTNDLLGDGEALIRKNWGQDELGALKKVNGYTKKNSTLIHASPIHGLFRVYKSAGSDELLAICNGAMYYSDNEGTSWTAATSGGSLSTSDFFTGVNYNDLFFFTSPTDNLKHFTPSTNTVAAATDTPTVGCKVLFKRADRRLVALVNSTNGSTLYHSKVDPTGTAADDWSATGDAGSIAIDGTKSDPLTAGISLGTYDLIFKDATAFKVWDYPATKAVRIIGSPGCAAPYSIASGGGYIFLLGRDAIWMWDGVSFTKISDPVRSVIAGINSTYIQNAFAVYRNGFYLLFYTPTGQTTNTKCLVYDVKYSNPYDNKCIWYERDDLAINCPLVLSGTGDANEIYGGDAPSTGFIYRLDNGTSDNTANITAIYQTKYFDMKASNVVKRFAKVYIEYYNTSGTFTINWYVNRGSATGSYTITGTGGSAIDIQTLPDTAVGTDFSVKVTHVGASTAPVIRSIEIEYEFLYRQ